MIIVNMQGNAICDVRLCPPAGGFAICEFGTIVCQLPTGTAVPIRQPADTGLVLLLRRSPKLPSHIVDC